MTPDTPPPHELARFDQVYARTGEQLDTLIEAHRGVLAEAAAPREVDVTGLCAWIAANVEPDAMAEILTVAVDRLTTMDAERAEIEHQVRVKVAEEIASVPRSRHRAYERGLLVAEHIARGEA